jgi:hypothetical protein
MAPTVALTDRGIVAAAATLAPRRSVGVALQDAGVRETEVVLVAGFAPLRGACR